MKVGDRVRTRPGYEDTVMPGYEGVLTAKSGDDATVKVEVLPSGFRLAEDQEATLHTFAHKLEVIADE